MTHRVPALALVAAFATLASSGHPAQGVLSPSGSAGLPSSAATCVLRGVAEPRANASIQDAQGRLIARFSGAPTALLASDFPADAQGRARVETGTGAGGFRVRGLLAIADLPLYTTTNVPVVTGHVWIGARRAVTFVSSSPGRLRIEKRLSQPFSQTFIAWAPCHALSLATSPPQAWSPEGDARAYALKNPALELFEKPSGSLLSTLTRARDLDSVLFFSNEKRGDFVNLSYHGEVVVEAWARAGDLNALPPGETQDQPTPRSYTRSSPPRLAVQGEPRIVKPERAVPLRAIAKESDTTIGVIEPGAETYVLDLVAGWASVMPMNVVPGPDGQFWVKASDLGI